MRTCLRLHSEAELDSIKKFINKFSVQRRVRVGADDEDDEDAMMFAEEVETTVFKYREQLVRPSLSRASALARQAADSTPSTYSKG